MPTFRAGFAHPLDELRDEFDRLWTSLTTEPPLHGWGPAQPAGAFPAVNIAETDDCLTIEAELPGLDVGDVDISATGEELLLKGSRPASLSEGPEGSRSSSVPEGSDGNGSAEPRGVTWHRRERGSGTFERRITLPVTIDPSGVEARLVDGVLTVTCPKAAEAQPHRVSVHSA
jgi:HSP20 family protein